LLIVFSGIMIAETCLVRYKIIRYPLWRKSA